MRKKTVNVGLIGFGTVGSGVVKLFDNNSDVLERKAGIPVRLKSICDIKFKNKKNAKLDKHNPTTNAADILNDPDIDIVVELIGGYKPALDFILTAMENKKHVVSANKALIAKYWEEIWTQAKKNNVEFEAEASVGGGIPVLIGLRHGLAANKIQKIMAIVNGTTNYILTKMTLEKMDFATALKQAQDKGFAEKVDPSLDIDGFDAMHKIVILSSMAFGRRVKESEVYVDGISKVDSIDIEYAHDEFGYIMKLLAIAEKGRDGLNIRVHPALVPQTHPLASVNYEFNAIEITGDASGDIVFIGRGAGEMPTASAVLSDIIDIAKDIASGTYGQIYEQPVGNNKIQIKKIDDIRCKYYLRFNVVDKAGVLGEIACVLGKHNISIKSVIQKSRAIHKEVPVVIMTYEAREADLMHALEKIDSMDDVIKHMTVYYRVIE